MRTRPVWEEYDFDESTVLDIGWSRQFRDLELGVNYCWDLDDPERPHPADHDQPLLVRLVGCIWCVFNTGRQLCELEGEYGPQLLTIIGWSVHTGAARDLAGFPYLVDALAAGYHYVYFVSSHRPTELWIQAVCQDITVTRL